MKRWCLMHNEREEFTDKEEDKLIVMLQLQPRGIHCLKTLVTLGNTNEYKGRVQEALDR